MFGRGPFSQMFGDDFLQDPFFRDLNHLFGTTGFPDPAQHMSPWAPMALPQRRGREVPVESSGQQVRAQASTQPAFRIEEVSDDDHNAASNHVPVVEEPEEGHMHPHRCNPVRAQAQSNALLNPLQSFLNNHAFGNAFGNPNLFGNSDTGDCFFYSSTTVSQQGPDGTQCAQTHSSSYGPHGVAEHCVRMKDGQTGCEEVTISRHLGDQGQTVTSQRQADGKQSQQQRLHNMREGDAGQFDEEWTYEAERSLPMYMRQNTAALPQASRASRQPAVGFRW